jgi:hypothetical protein
MTTKADVQKSIHALAEQMAEVATPGREALTLADVQGLLAQRYVATVTRRIKAAEKEKK